MYLLKEQRYLSGSHDTGGFTERIKGIQGFEQRDASEILLLLRPNDRTTVSTATSHFVQEQVHTNTVQSNVPCGVAPGILNSLKRVTQFQNLNLNTCFRHNYYMSNPCDYQYAIPTEIKNVVSMRLASVELPNAWYLFSTKKKNNVMIVNSATSGAHKILVPDGNLDATSLQSYLNSTYFYMSATTTDLIYLKFSIDQYSFKSKFEVVGLPPSPVSFSINFVDQEANQNVMDTLGWLLGFRIATYTDITSIVISEGLFDGGGDRYVYIAIDDYQYNTNALNIVGLDKSIIDKNIIAKIPMVDGKLSLTVDDNTSPLTKTRKYNGPVSIRTLNIKVLDKYGHVIDLNNMDYSLTLELEILYEGFNFHLV